jgi:transcription-repair coupling factor (superfamily II helicase)
LPRPAHALGAALCGARGVYDEFSARFPYEETEDQLNSIDAVRDDLASGRPMDRLVCGDVGFGKTEVALRAAFLAAMSGRQVAVVVPTTLLARQHFKTFSERFHGLPINVPMPPGWSHPPVDWPDQEGHCRRIRRHRRRHPCAAWENPSSSAILAC